MPFHTPENASETMVADFTRSIPPLPSIFRARMSEALAKIAAEPELDLMVRTSVPGGLPHDRDAALTWLAPRLGTGIQKNRVTITNGTQSAALLLLHTLVGRDGILLAESLSWGALREIAARTNVRLKGVPTDEYGILPDALEAACRVGKPKALYCNPTDQNPTTAIMSEERRHQIVDIARRYGLTIIEDDALGLFHAGGPAPIATLAPDITWYVMGLTKCISQGLRLAYVVGPSDADTDRVIGPSRKLSYWAPHPVTVALATAWIRNGAAQEICDAIRHESEERERLAASVLSFAGLMSTPAGMHAWLPLRDGFDRHELTASLKIKGVAIRPAELFAVDDAAVPNAVRLSLSSPRDLQQVRQGLEIIANEINH